MTSRRRDRRSWTSATGPSSQNIQGYAIYAIDPHGLVTEWADGAKQIKGYEPWEVIGRDCAMFHTAEARAAGEPQAILEHAASTGRAETESWHVRKDGSRFWAHEICTPIRDDDGTLLGFTKVSRDMTVHRMLEQRQEESLAREREGREAAEAFMAVMSHELRTPVTTIYGTASLLTRDPTRADGRELLADISDEAERLLRIVDDLLVLSRVERGVVVLTPEPIVVRHVVADVLAIVRRRYPSARIEVAGTAVTPALADADGASPGHPQPAHQRGQVRGHRRAHRGPPVRGRRPGPDRGPRHGPRPGQRAR